MAKRINWFQKCVKTKMAGRHYRGRKDVRKSFKRAVEECSIKQYKKAGML